MAYPEDIQAAENKRIEELNQRFRDSIKQTIADTDWSEIERQLMLQSPPEQIGDTVSWQGYNPQEVLEETFWDTSKITAAYIGDVVSSGSKIDFKLTDPNAVKWLKEFGADEVKYISDSQRSAIKDIVTRGYQDGITYQQQARQIKQIIGLDPRRAEAVENLRQRLMERGRISDAKIERQADRYAEKLLKQRSRTIAVQEATVAGARGYYETTKDAVSRGILDPRKYEGYRIVTGDERLCPKCSAQAGEARSLPDGVYQSSGSVTPKLHTICRCVEGIREIKMTTKREGKPRLKESGKTTTDIVFEAKSLKRKDGIIYCPTVPLVEGVFEGLGFPVLRLYEEFSKDAKWLNGLTVLSNHEDLTPDARRVGQLTDVQPRPEKLDVAAVTQFYEIDLTQREIETILSREPIHGSARLSYNLEESSGTWNGKPYVAIERGPYVFYEYSMVRQGVVTPEDGAGFNLECTGCKSKSHSYAPGGAGTMTAETEARLVERLDTLEGKVATLEQEKETLKGELKTLKESNEAKQEAVHKERFVGKLKPAFLEKADEHWQECKAIGYLAFEAKHPEMIIQPVQERKLRGSAMTGEGGGEWDLEKERAKAKAEGKVI